MGARDWERLQAADNEASHHTRERKPLVPEVAKLRLLIYETIPNNYDIELQIFSPVSLRRLCKLGALRTFFAGLT